MTDSTAGIIKEKERGSLMTNRPKSKGKAEICGKVHRCMRVLGIETSCDETAVAVYDSDRGLLAHQLYSQIAMHAGYGGVVPELAARDHVRKLLPLFSAALHDAQLEKHQLDAVAYTAGPGLIG